MAGKDVKRGVVEILREAKLMTKNGDTSFESLSDGKKAIGIYFSAHWCPPCRGFTPVLTDWYNEQDEKEKAEIIFVSADRDQDAFDGYYGEMPWAALKFVDREAKKELNEHYSISGIPTLIFIKPDGDTLTIDGRSLVASGGNIMGLIE